MSSSPTRSPAAEPPAARRWLTGPWPAVVLGLLCFANTLGNGFTYDDNAIIRDNQRIRSLGNLRTIWLTDWWYQPTSEQPLLDPGRDRLYRPLTLQSFALNYAVGRLDPWGYHLVNVLLHGVACWLVWLLLVRLLGDRAVAALTAVVFAVHPVHCEAVAGVVGRAEVLAAVFLLAGLVVLLKDARRPPGWRRLLAAGSLFLAACFSKETAVCFPAVAAVALHARYGRAVWGGWLRTAGLLVVPLLVYLPMRYVALEHHLLRERVRGILFTPLVDADLFGRLHGPLTILGHYARLLIVPRKLSCDYGLAVFDPRQGPQAMTLVGLLALAALLAALWGYRRRAGAWRNLAALGAMFIASYVLISNTVLLIGVSIAERLMYWPSVPALAGLCVLLAAGWRRWCVPGAPLAARAGLLRGLGLTLLAALALRSVVRNTDWHDDARLFAADVQTFPDSAHLNNSLAQHYIEAALETGDNQQRAALLDQAQALLERALAVEMRYPDALRQMAEVFALRGQYDKAREYVERSLLLAPGQIEARKLAARLRDPEGRLGRQVAELRRRVARQPDDVASRLELVRALLAAGQNYPALQEARAAAGRSPRDPQVLKLLAESLLVNQQDGEAAKVYQQVLELAPDDWQAHSNLAKLLADSDPQASLRHARRAWELRPDDLRTQTNLAEALALNGRYDEALGLLENVRRHLPADDPLRGAISERIAELKRKRP